MRMGQGVKTGLGHGGITCVLQTQISSFFFFFLNIFFILKIDQLTAFSQTKKPKRPTIQKNTQNKDTLAKGA